MRLITVGELLAYVLCAAVVAALIYRFRRFALRGVPSLSAEAVGLLRIAFGVLLLYGLVKLDLPDRPGGPGAPSEATLWRPWAWVEYLATHWHERDALYAATGGAAVAFTVGLFARAAYAAVVAGFLVRLLVAQEYGVGSHTWVIFPLVLAPLLVVRWGDALSVDAWLRRRRGKPSRVLPPGPRYGIAVWLPGLTLGCAWLAAALAKMASTGPEWILGGAVRYHWAEDFLQAKVDWGGWIAGHAWAAVLASAAGVAAEALFITHVLVRNQWVRFAYGLLGLSLLSGFLLFQGVFWYPWWATLVFFLPWQAVADAFGRRLRNRGAAESAADRGLGRHAAVVAVIAALLLVQQAVMVRESAEQMPFFSNYPMYSHTRASPAEFNTVVAPLKFYRYRVTAVSPGPPREITSQLDPSQALAVRDAVAWRLRYGTQPLGAPEVERLAQLRESYGNRHGGALQTLRVDTTARIFDFSAGGLTTEGAPAIPPMTIDLVDLEVRELA